MRKRAERTVEELYDITDMITQPEMTPVLEGSCRIQGPVDESDNEFHRMNSGACPAEKKFNFVKESLHKRVESGTCNVCSAPCSSCMHNNRTMSARESNIECGSSRNPFSRKESDSCSFIGVDGMPIYKSRRCDDSQQAASETSNLLSASSSHDSYSENAESKAPRPSIKCDSTEDVDLPHMVPSSEIVADRLQEKKSVTSDGLPSSKKKSNMFHRMSPSKDGEQQRLECHGDNISCLTGTRDSSIGAGHHDVVLDKTTNTVFPRDIENPVQVEATKGLHSSPNEDSFSTCKERTVCPKESLQKHADSANSALCDDSYLADMHLANDSPKIRSPSFCSRSGYAACFIGDLKDTEGSTSSKFCVDGVSPLGSQSAGTTSFNEKNLSSNNENRKANHVGTPFSSDDLKMTDTCLKTEHVENGISPANVVKTSTIKEEVEMPSSFVEVSNTQPSQLQPQQVMEGGNSESDTELTDVKVCDICGDAGREELLAVCSRCSDGAEHTYCMREMLRKVPDGEWLCEECQLKEDAERKKVDMTENVSGTMRECKLKDDADVNKVDRSDKVSRIAKACSPKEEDAEVKMDRSEMAFGFSKECKPKKDFETKQMDKTANPKLSCLNKTSQNFASTSNSKLMSKLDMKTINPDVRRIPKGGGSPRISGKRQVESQEIVSLNCKRPHPETSEKPVEIGSPRKKIALSRESSFKNLDTGKARVQSTNSSQALSRSQSMLGSHATKVAQVQPSLGILPRSSSFNNSSKPKVKQLTESVPVKSKMTRQFSVNDTRKEALARSLTKSTSFKSISSIRPNSEAAIKTPVEDPRHLKQVKERNMTEKKNSSMHERPITISSPRVASTISSPRVASTIPFPKAETKTALHDLKSKNISESNNLKTNKGLDDASGSGRKTSKILGSASLNAKCNNEDQRPCQTPREGARGTSSIDKSYNNAESIHRDDKMKDTSVLNSSRQMVSGGNRIIRCQKCKETGHATQFCSIDKLRSSALKPSIERNSKDGNKNGSKWKVAVEATISKSRIQKNSKKNDQLEEFPDSTSKDCLFSSSNPSGDNPTVVGTTDGLEIDRSLDLNPIKTHGPHALEPVEASCTPQGRDLITDALEPVEASCTPQAIDLITDALEPVEASCTPQRRDLITHALEPVEASCTPQGRDLITISAVSDEISRQPLLTDEASVLASPFRTGAIPELKFTWRGSLEVLSSGNRSTLFDGFQAHLSDLASPKVLEVTTTFPCSVKLEEVSCNNSWPLHSQGISPDEHNIALFFFAKDVESYETSYNKLLERMLKNDLALRGVINGVELLIFPSNKLPVHSQRWNRLFFLWGIFKGSRTDTLTSKPVTQRKPSGPMINMKPLILDLPCALSSEENIENKSPRCDRLPRTKALEPTASLETCAISSSPYVVDRMDTSQESPPVHNSSSQLAAADNRLLLKQNSDGQSLRSINLNVDIRPESRFQVTNTPSCSEVNIDDSYLKNSAHDFGGRFDVSASPRVLATNQQIELNRASLSYPTSPDCSKGRGNNTSGKETGVKEISFKSEYIFYDDPRGIDSRKRAHSYSTETVSQVSVETIKSNVETLLSKDNVSRPLCFPMDNERELKRLCYSEERASSSNREDILSARSSSKVHPLFTGFLNDQAVISDTREHTEKFFFPVEPCPVRNTKSDNIIHILSSDDEDGPDFNIPDLELALWGKRKSQKDRPRKKLLEDDADVSASLDLSLAIPTPPKEWLAKSDVKAEQHSQERPDVNTALLLFSGFTDT